MREYLNVTQAAKRRGVARQTIHKAIRDGRLRAYQIAGHTALRAEDVDVLVILPPNERRKGVLFPGGRGRPKGRE